MDLAVLKREQLGRSVKALRSQGLIPAELYGHGISNAHLAVKAVEFNRIFKDAGETTMINLVLDGEKTPVLIHEVQHHPTSDDVIAIDFYQPRLDQTLTLNIPLRFSGEAPAVKEKGGVLVKAMAELEVETLPTNIPHDIEVNLVTLSDIGSSIHVKDLQIPQGVEISADPESVIATVIEKITEEEEAAMAAEADVSTIKTEGEEEKAAVASSEEGEEPGKSPEAKPEQK